MLKNKQNNQTQSNTTTSFNKIVESTVLTGDITAESNFRLDGKLNGTFRSKSKLVIGLQGEIEGEVHCSDAEIEGTVKGDIFISGNLTLRSTAKVKGTIKAGQLQVENGAEFIGSCSMGNESNKILKIEDDATGQAS